MLHAGDADFFVFVTRSDARAYRTATTPATSFTSTAPVWRMNVPCPAAASAPNSETRLRMACSMVLLADALIAWLIPDARSKRVFLSSCSGATPGSRRLAVEPARR